MSLHTESSAPRCRAEKAHLAGRRRKDITHPMPVWRTLPRCKPLLYIETSDVKEDRKPFCIQSTPKMVLLPAHRRNSRESFLYVDIYVDTRSLCRRAEILYSISSCTSRPAHTSLETAIHHYAQAYEHTRSHLRVATVREASVQFETQINEGSPIDSPRRNAHEMCDAHVSRCNHFCHVSFPAP